MPPRGATRGVSSRRGRPAAVWLGVVAFALQLHLSSPVNVAEILAGRRIPAPPVAGPRGFRRWAPDHVEVQLRAFYRRMGGPHWRHNHGWRDEQSEAPPPPARGNGTVADLRNTADAVWGRCNGTLLRLAPPNVSFDRFDGRSSPPAQPWSMPVVLPATDGGYPYIRHQLYEGDLDMREPDLMKVLLQRPREFWDVSPPWANMTDLDIAMAGEMAVWVSNASLEVLKEWGAESTRFYRDVAEFGIASSFDRTTSATEGYATVLQNRGFGMVNGSDTLFHANETVDVVVSGNDLITVLNYRHSLQGRINALQAEQAALSQLDDRDSQDRVAEIYGELAYLHSLMNQLKELSNGGFTGIDIPAAHTLSSLKNLTDEENVQLLRAYSRVLTDVEQWCWTHPEFCKFRLKRYPEYKQIVLPTWNESDPNITLHTMLLQNYTELQILNSRIEYEQVQEEGAEAGGARRRMAEGVDAADDAEVLGPVIAQQIGGDVNASWNGSVLNMWVGYRLNVTLEINTSHYGFGIWNDTRDQVYNDMQQLKKMMPSLYSVFRDITFSETGEPVPGLDPTIPSTEIATYGAPIWVEGANDTLEWAFATREVDENGTLTGTLIPYDYNVDLAFGIHRWQDWHDWRWENGWIGGWENTMSAGYSAITFDWYFSISTVAEHLDDIYNQYVEYAMSRKHRSCTWDLIKENTYCSNAMELGQNLSLPECAAAVEEVGPEMSFQCVSVNRVYDNPGRLTCDCVQPTDPCIASGFCVRDESSCGEVKRAKAEVCSDVMLGNGKACRCVPAGQECQEIISTAKSNLYRRRCASSTDKYPMLRYLSQTQENMCAFYATITDLLERSPWVDTEALASASSSCEDGKHNGDEEDIDCGGSCAACFVPAPLPCRQLWYGTFCEEGKLVRLDLHGNNLTGRLGKALDLPATLRSLDLRANSIRSTIPKSVGNLSSLRYLDLSRNQLTGALPETLETLSGLTHFSAEMNGMSGRLPETLPQWPSIQHLNLRDNRIRGDLSAIQFDAMPQLRHVNLRGNLFDGRLPYQPNISNASLELVYLDLSHNYISGEIPADMLNLTKLHYVNLGSNQLAGELPDLFMNLQQLYHLDVSHNRISGSIPESFTSLESLQYVNMKDNRIGGVLPEMLQGLHKVHSFLTPVNQISGTLPVMIGAMTSMRFLDLSSNSLSGTLPVSLEEIRNSITDLNLGRNNFQPSAATGKAEVPERLCDIQAGNICRGGGACVERTCACADGASGMFCETIDNDAIGVLTFTGIQTFDTSIFEGNVTVNVTNSSMLSTGAAGDEAVGSG